MVCHGKQKNLWTCILGREEIRFKIPVIEQKMKKKSLADLVNTSLWSWTGACSVLADISVDCMQSIKPPGDLAKNVQIAKDKMR